jgi:hypothetical protein
VFSVLETSFCLSKQDMMTKVGGEGEQSWEQWRLSVTGIFCLVSLEMKMPFVVLLQRFGFFSFFWAKLKEIDRPHKFSRGTFTLSFIKKEKRERPVMKKKERTWRGDVILRLTL